MSKLLTVAIPTYNGGDNLIRAVKSCKNINLSYDEYEILVVDNCSNDGSIEKVKQLKEKELPNIRIVVNEKNLGRIGNWNRCLELAKGEYLIFLFSNDELLEYDYKGAMEILINNDDIGMIYNRVEYDFVNEKNITSKLYKDGEKVDYYSFVEDNFLKQQNFTSFGIPQQHIFSMNIIKKHHIIFDENIPRTADRVFIAKNILLSNKKIYFLNKIQTKWNLSENRFHFKVHVKKNDVDIFKNFKTSWIEEIEANKYIMISANISDKIVFEKHYEKFYLLNIILNLKKYFFFKKLDNPDYITIKLFLVYLELNCKQHQSNISYLKLISYYKIILKIIRKIF